MKVLVTGRHGQLAQALLGRARAHPNLALRFAGRPEFDLADADSIARTIEDARPDVIVSAAAHTAVDAAEDEPDLAEAINARGPAVLAAAAQAVGARIIHLSTDYVFDGTSPEPYREDAEPGPLGVYGRTKLAGEEAVRRACPDHLVLRTAWVYGPVGRNFLTAMLALAATRDSVRVVDDQFGSPTSASDLADGIARVLDVWRTGARTGLGRTFHFAGTGSASWADLARCIFEESRRRGGPSAVVSGIATAQWPTRAARPRYSRLASDAFVSAFDHPIPHWRESVPVAVAEWLRPCDPDPRVRHEASGATGPNPGHGRDTNGGSPDPARSQDP